MGVVQNTIDIEKIRTSGGDPELAEKVSQLEAEIGDADSGIVKDIDDLQEANALIMTSVSAIKTTADSAKTRADQAVIWSERKGYVGKNLFKNTASTSTATNITFTVNADKSVSITGSANTSATTKDLGSFTGAELKTIGSTLILTGGSQKAYLALRSSTWSKIIRSYGEAVNVNTSELEDATTYYMTIGIQANDNPDGEVIYPMIRLSSISDNTYEPYLQSNEELTGNKLDTATLKTVTASAADFAAFKTAIAAL